MYRTDRVFTEAMMGIANIGEPTKEKIVPVKWINPGEFSCAVIEPDGRTTELFTIPEGATIVTPEALGTQPEQQILDN